MIMGALAGLKLGEIFLSLATATGKVAVKEFSTVFDVVSKALSEYVDAHVKRSPTVTYSEIVQYLIQVRKENPCVNKAAMLRRRDNEHQTYELCVICLNEKDDMLYDNLGHPVGRSYVCKEIDSDLSDIFNGKDIVIFQ